MTARGVFWTLTLGALLAWFTGCGDVTEVAELAAADAGAEQMGAPDGAAETNTARPDAVDHDTVSTSEVPVSCIAAGCPACVASGAPNTTIQSVASCEAIIACVRTNTGMPGYGYPWQACADEHGASLAGAGLQCAQALAQACP